MGTMLIETRRKTESEMVGPRGRGLKEDGSEKLEREM
jgi:hypothetical protein